MKTIEIINQIEADKKERKIEPAHALVCEVIIKAKKYYQICTDEIVMAELEELVKQGVILMGDTINDKYIKILI
ncbi:MAG: hypothetical protein BGO29_14905 [Bacteroidales bacterium 36-12]|nr:MAG: hypothetical protein BGO29_14905 [Bacteroidales bacterium 36-12]